jgi:hypothetical protein
MPDAETRRRAMKLFNRGSMLWIILLSMGAAACGAEKAAVLVASYPRASAGGRTFSVAADGPVVVETIFLTLEVNDPESAAESAAHLADGYGGYEGNRYAWDSGYGRTLSQEIFVPLDQAESLRMRLRQMGRTIEESIVRDSAAGYHPGESWAQFSTQYRIRPETADWNDWETGQTQHPERTDYFKHFCGFVEDAAAFLLQMGGGFLLAACFVIPLCLMIAGAIALIRRLFPD